NGWTFVLNIAGEAAQSDIERYINLETISYNADKKMLDWDDLIVEGKENIEKILNKYEGIAFEQHRNYYYDCLITKSIDSLEKFLSTRLNRKDCYIYDGEAEGLPYFRINIEMDGDRITFLLGDVEGDDYKSFSYETNFCPLFPDEISITWLGEEIKDWGSVQLNGIKYFYSVIQNYDKYITTVSWINDGIRFSITTRGSTWGKVDSQIVEQWVSHVKHMMID
ncbi:MAG: hypothetical protein Q8O09_04125, partial [Bacillota bacterium]|nr:hypothetical protein [Bacillota bacterium]